MYQVSQYVKANVLGTAVLLEGIAENQSKPDRFILASSRAVYGEGKYYCKKHKTFSLIIDMKNIYQKDNLKFFALNVIKLVIH